jgi:steroid delta-isomerase-like uncharacterized protein
MPKPTEIAAVVQECFNRRDAQALLALWTDDFEFQGPNSRFIGKQRMLAQEQNLWTAFPDIRCEVSTFIAGSDRATLLTTMIGTHAGPLRLGATTVAATGRRVEFTLSVHMMFRDGLIAGERLFFDTAGFTRQLGLT